MLTVADVARQLGGLCRTRVIALDPVLQPRRSETGVRLYDQRRVDYVAGARAALMGAQS